mgnify:CR=1 FL=1
MRRQREDKIDTPITSMIDIVFLLIIFFVVTASINKEVVDESIKLARAKYAKAVEKKDPRTITVNVDEDGEMNIGLIRLNSTQLAQQLQAARAQFGNTVPILVRGDREALYRDIEKVVDGVAKAGLWRISIAGRSVRVDN